MSPGFRIQLAVSLGDLGHDHNKVLSVSTGYRSSDMQSLFTFYVVIIRFSRFHCSFSLSVFVVVISLFLYNCLRKSYNLGA